MASALGPQIWRGVRETALLARPLGLSHILAAICQKTDGGEAEAGERGGTGLASYHTLDLPTFSPPEELFLAPKETCAHNQAGISLVGDVCFHWGPLPLCSLLRAHRPGPELGAGLLERPLLDCERRAALTHYHFMPIESLGSWAPDWPTAGWDRVVSPNSTRLRPLQQEQPLGGHSWWNLKEKLAQEQFPTCPASEPGSQQARES